jgi:serine protease Do
MNKISYLVSFLSLFFIVSISCVLDINAEVDDLRITPVVKAVQNSKLSVVNISTYEQVYERVNPFSSLGRDPFFDGFFNNFFDYRLNKKSVKTQLGSGVIIDSRGYVLTNWHVVDKATSITVSTVDEKEFKAELIGADPKSDLALLKIESKETFPKIPLGDSDNILIGETVIAIGNPFGLSHTVTTGVVSALHRSIKSNYHIYDNFIQTDTSINPGNSGGPLLNINGELIGINTAIYGGAEGIGFAIPINTARRIVDDLLAFGEVHPPWLGISVQDLTPDISERLGFKDASGVIISEIFPDSPADKSGFKTADIIISIDDQQVKSKSAFKRIIGLYAAKNRINIKIFRDGALKKLSVISTEFPLKYIEDILWKDLGIKIINNNSQISQRYGLYSSSGVVISEINKRGQAFNIGLRPGDLILKVQTVKINNINDFTKQIANNIYRDSVLLLVQRGKYGYYVNFEM